MYAKNWCGSLFFLHISYVEVWRLHVSYVYTFVRINSALPDGLNGNSPLH